MRRWFTEGLIGAVVCLGFIQAAGLIPIEDNPDASQWSFMDQSSGLQSTELISPPDSSF